MSEVISNQRKSVSAHGCLIVICPLLIFVGLALVVPLLILPVLEMLDARSWVQVPCEILESRVDTNRDSDGDTYAIHIKYRYEYPHDGPAAARQAYESSRYYFTRTYSSGYESKEAVIDQYPVGAKRTCWVDPDNPSEAVIKRGLSFELLLGLIPLAFIVIGIVGLWRTVFRKEKGEPALSDDAPQSTSPARRLRRRRKARRSVDANGGVTLRPEQSAMGKLGVILFMCLFWNLIVGIFLRDAFYKISQGNPDYGLCLFLIPFVLIGLGLIIGVFYMFLALFNPTPELCVDSDAVPIGSTVGLSWRLNGNVGRIQKWSIALIAREEATYRQGTSTSTDKEFYYYSTIVETDTRREIESGEAQFTVPFDLMPSFESSNNKFVWRIKVRGVIDWWPDVSNEFKFTVLPIAPGDAV